MMLVLLGQNPLRDRTVDGLDLDLQGPLPIRPRRHDVDPLGIPNGDRGDEPGPGEFCGGVVLPGHSGQTMT